MQPVAAAAYHAVMLSKLRPWLACIVLAAVVAVLAVVHAMRPRTPPVISTPATLLAAAPLPPGPSIAPVKLPDYFENVLRARGMYASLVPCDGRPGFYDLYISPPDDPDAPHALAVVEVRPGESAPPAPFVPGDYRVGPYHVVGNPAVVTRVRQALPSWGDER